MFDTHTHVDTIRCEDLEMMALTGIRRLILVVGPNGCTTHTTLLDYYRQLLTTHSKRIKDQGIEPYVALGIHPKSIPKDYEEAIKKLPSQLCQDQVVAVGEIGINSGDRIEKEVFKAQIDIAGEYEMPVILHTPRLNKKRIVGEMLDVVKQARVETSRVIFDHSTEDVVGPILSAGAVPGLTLREDLLPSEKALDLLSENGKHLVLNSDANGLGPSDPIAVPRFIRSARLRKIDESMIQHTTWDNPNRIFRI